MFLELYTRMQMPIDSAAETGVHLLVRPVIEEVDRRGLRSAHASLGRILAERPHPRRTEPGRPNLHDAAEGAFVRLEVAMASAIADWRGVVRVYAEIASHGCLGKRHPDRARAEAADAALGALVLEADARALLVQWGSTSGTCERRRLAHALASHLAEPTDLDRVLLRSMLKDPDPETQRSALTTLLRSLNRTDRIREAKDYLRSSARLGEYGRILAERARDGSLTDEDLLTVEQSREKLRALQGDGPRPRK
jgi:hypothetical protein